MLLSVTMIIQHAPDTVATCPIRGQLAFHLYHQTLLCMSVFKLGGWGGGERGGGGGGKGVCGSYF